MMTKSAHEPPLTLPVWSGHSCPLLLTWFVYRVVVPPVSTGDPGLILGAPLASFAGRPALLADLLLSVHFSKKFPRVQF
jgi:hypothetical protein